MKRKRFAVSFARMSLGWPDAPALLAWLLPVFAWAPLAYPGYPELHSGFLAVFNLVDFAARWGEWGWMPLIGWPFDPWRGEGSLPYALAALFRLAGISPGDAIKLVFAAGLVAGSVGMYRWARSGLGPWPALVAALAYVYWPMGLAQVLVRGALAEAVLLGLLPWVLQAAQHLRNRGFSRPSLAGVTVSPGDEDREVSCAVALALGIAAVLWTQAGLGLWLAGLLVGWWLAGLGMGLRLRLRLKSQADAAKSAEAGSRDGRPGVFLAGWAGGLILGLLGLLPAVLRHGWGSTTYVTFSDHFVYPHQLLWAGWGRGPSIPGADDTLSFSLGLVAFGLVAIALVWPQRSGVTGKSETQNGTLGYLLPALLVVFMASSLAAVVWRPLSFAALTLTYPWQLLLLAGPWWAYVAGIGARKLVAALPGHAEAGRSIPLGAALAVLIVLSVYGDLRLEPAGTQPPLKPVAVYGQDEIVLLRATTSGTPGPGGRVSVAVAWQALRPLDRDYTVFFHVLGPDGERYGQQDTMPSGGELPTSRWRPGQVMSDEYSVTLASDAPVGEGYRYWLGFYDLATGERLAVGTDDKVVLEP